MNTAHEEVRDVAAHAASCERRRERSTAVIARALMLLDVVIFRLDAPVDDVTGNLLSIRDPDDSVADQCSLHRHAVKTLLRRLSLIDTDLWLRCLVNQAWGSVDQMLALPDGPQCVVSDWPDYDELAGLADWLERRWEIPVDNTEVTGEPWFVAFASRLAASVHELDDLNSWDYPKLHGKRLVE